MTETPAGLWPAGSSGGEAKSAAPGVGLADLERALNPEQLRAVLHPGGPLLIFAGAGSGKTRVLTYRLAHLIRERGQDAGSLMAVTFTNKAAAEMKERVAKLGGEQARGIWIGTFHAICARLLRVDIERLGYKSNFVVFDDGDQQAAMRECLKAMNLDSDTHPPRAMLSVISRAKEALVDVDEFREAAVTPSDRTNARVFTAYQAKLRESNALDFDDLILLSVKLLETFPEVRERYQNRFKHIMVDEFQDVNHAQYRLIQLLSGRWKNILCVGDDDQSIYGWRGADVGIILRFEQDFPDATVIKLEQNYRSTAAILECANQVVRNNRSRREKSLWTKNPEGESVRLEITQDERQEASYVVRSILDEVSRNQRSWKDFGVLYRTNAQSRVLEEAFRARQVPYRMVGGQRFYERREIKDLISYLRVVYNPDDRPSTLRAVASPSRGVGAMALERIADFATAEGLSLYAAMIRAEEVPGLAARARAGALEFAGCIQEMRRLQESVSVGDLITRLIERSGYGGVLREDHTREGEERVRNVHELLNTARQFEETSEDASLSAFLETLSLASDLDTYQENGNAVTLMTLHTAKGLEFPVVFLVGLEEGLLPHQRGQESGSALEEERRLCYVGVTRAQERLYLSYANARMVMGTTSRTRPSRFVKEMRDSLEPSETPAAPRAGSAWSLFPSGTEHVRRRDFERSVYGAAPAAAVRREESPGASGVAPPGKGSAGIFKVGEKVRHKMLGIGLIVQIDTGQNTMKIAFEGQGIKKFQADLAPIEKM